MAEPASAVFGVRALNRRTSFWGEDWVDMGAVSGMLGSASCKRKICHPLVSLAGRSYPSAHVTHSQ